MARPKRTTQEILEDVRQTLDSAKLGLEAVHAADPRRRIAGIRNVVTFGKATTDVLRRLKTNEPGYEAWWEKYSTEMAADPVMKFFYKLRSTILHEGQLPTTSSMSFSGNLDVVLKTWPRPPGATGVFLGDTLGGWGWTVELPDGSTGKWYVEIPSKSPDFQLDIELRFTEAPIEVQKKSAIELCDRYVAYLDAMLKDAVLLFIKNM